MPEAKNTPYITAVGRRKTAAAQVRLTKSGSGVMTVNGKVVDSEAPFTAPLKLVGLLGGADVSALVKGGGKNGQSEAIRHGIARALVELDPEYRGSLRAAGFLTRDPRAKERKKFGLLSARRSPQWSKR